MNLHLDITILFHDKFKKRLETLITYDKRIFQRIFQINLIYEEDFSYRC